MRAALLIAWREYHQYIMTWGFWFGVLMFPLALGFGVSVPYLLENSVPVRHFVVVDRSGDVTPLIDEALESQYQRQVVQAFTLHVRATVRSEALKEDALPDIYTRTSVSTDQVAAFREAGGLEAALAAVEPYQREGVPAFEAPRRLNVRVDAPASVDPRATFEDIAEALSPYLRGNRLIETDEGGQELFAAFLIPDGLASADWTTPQIQYWSTNISDTALRTTVLNALNTALRTQEFDRRGIDAEIVADVRRMRVNVDVFDPRKTEAGGEVDVTDRLIAFIPFGLAYMLWAAIIMVANILLTNVVEEKSNKIVEILLSSVRVEELMLGKLIGVLGLGLTTLSIFVGGTVAVVMLAPGDVSQIAQPVIDALISTNMLYFFLFYFFIAYLTIGAVFLGVGSLCNSLSDAQSYLAPLMIFLVMPFAVLWFIPRDPNGTIAVILSWVPVYSPFVMMMRVSAGPSLFELIGTAVMMVLFAGLILWLMGRLFRNSILRTGQAPRFGEVIRLMRSQDT